MYKTIVKVYTDKDGIKILQGKIQIDKNTRQNSMLEKLTEDFHRTIKWRNFGHVIGFFKNQEEITYEKYEFPNGVYTVRNLVNNFVYWNYDIKDLSSLKFSNSLVELIRKKKKHTTWIINDDKDLVEGMLVGLSDKKGELFEHAIITYVKEKKFEELTQKDKEKHEMFFPGENMYKTYSNYYGLKITSNTKLKIVKFELIK